MKHKLLTILMSLILVFVMFSATACAAASLPTNYVEPINGGGVPIRPETVIYGISQAIADKPGVAAMKSTVEEGQYVIIWYNSYGASFFGADLTKYKTLADMRILLNQGGTLVNAKNGNEFMQFLEQNGWVKVAGASLPKIFADIVESGKLPPWLVKSPNSVVMYLLMFTPNLNPDYCGSAFQTDLMGAVLCGDNPDNKS